MMAPSTDKSCLYNHPIMMLYCVCSLYVQMALAPSAPITQRSARSNVPLVGLALLYGLVLLASWSHDTLHLMMPGSLEEGLKGVYCAVILFVMFVVVVVDNTPACPCQSCP
jgi:hypothetical protein